MIKFRPHHFLCTQSFQGKGYSPEFVKKYFEIKNSLAPETLIHVVLDTEDSICQSCPNRQGARCATEEKVQTLDAKHAKILSLCRGDSLTWGAVLERLATKMTVDDFHRVCAPCGWKELGVCEKTLKELKK
ncbi:DUF1284 domain-containing protein [Bdellovibrionota bacterium FG-2]